MTFLVTLFALMTERFFDWSHLRNWHWVVTAQYVIAKYSRLSPALNLVILLSGISIVWLMISSLIANSFFGLLYLLISYFVLIYCLGPKNFWASSFAEMNALTFAQTTHNLNIKLPEIASQLDPSVQLFLAAYQRVFAVIVSYLLFGILGAIIYRSLLTLAEQEETDHFYFNRLWARNLLSYADWLFIRLFIALFALGDNMQRTWHVMREKALHDLTSSWALLVETSQLALQAQTLWQPNDINNMRRAVQIIDKTCILLLTLTAIGVIVF